MSSLPEAASAERPDFDFRQLEPPPERQPAPRPEDLHARAEAIVAAAEAEAARVTAEAQRVGFEQGFEAGQASAISKLEPAASAMNDALAAARQLTERSADAAERQAVELALQIAEKVVAGAIECQPERVLDVVTGALRALVERERVVLLVNPDDLELVRSSIKALSASLGGIEHVDVQEERRVNRGGAILRTTVGEMDARIETKLARARAALEAELAR